MSQKIVMGIDVGTSAVKTVIAAKDKGETEPRVLGVGASLSQGLRKGIIINQQDVATAIKNSVIQASRMAKISPKSAIISIGGTGTESVCAEGSIIVSRADQEITENDIKRAANQSKVQLNRNSASYLLNREILHSFPLAYKINDETIIGSPIGMKGEKLEAETLFITTQLQHFNNLLKTMDLAGINVEDIVVDSIANSHSLLSTKEKEVGCLLANIGGDTSSLIVFEEGVPISLEIFPIGSNHITYDIAQGFQVVLDEADKMKISYGSDTATAKKLNPIISPRLNDIFDLIQGHLSKIKRNKLLPAGVILTGGGANLHGIEEFAKTTLKLPTQLSRPVFESDPDNPLNDPIWSVASGLCYIGFNDKNSIIIKRSEGLINKIKKIFTKIIKNFLP